MRGLASSHSRHRPLTCSCEDGNHSLLSIADEEYLRHYSSVHYPLSNLTHGVKRLDSGIVGSNPDKAWELSSFFFVFLYCADQ
jgi:hypothetical protein